MKDVNRYKTEADTKSTKPKVDLDYTKTRPKSIRRYGKNEKGMKVVISQAEIIPITPPRTGNVAAKIRFTKKQFKARMKSKAARQARKINRNREAQS